MSRWSPLQYRLEEAIDGVVPAGPARCQDLADALIAALRAQAELADLTLSAVDDSRFDFEIAAAAPGLTPTDRGVIALTAWSRVAGDDREWHAAWTDGPILSLDVLHRSAEDYVLGRVVLRPG